MDPLLIFISGAIGLGYGVVALFFLKFWRRTRDALFASFALAFAVLMVLRLILSGIPSESELKGYLYLGRLFAYLIILWAIIQKNRRTPGSTSV